MSTRKPQANESKRAVGYVRVSTEEQAREGLSLEAQRARIAAWCGVSGYELVAVHSDEGLSGKRADTRPGLQAALADTSDGAALVVYSLSRVSRSTRDMLAIADQLERAGADLVSLTEKIDTTGAAGRMVFRMLAVLNEFERDQVAERTRSALAHKKSKGEATGRIPRGCRIEGKRLVGEPGSEGLRLAARARELRAGGMSFARIAEQLAAEGFQPERGRRIYPGAVRYIVNNARLAAVA